MCRSTDRMRHLCFYSWEVIFLCKHVLHLKPRSCLVRLAWLLSARDKSHPVSWRHDQRDVPRVYDLDLYVRDCDRRSVRIFVHGFDRRFVSSAICTMCGDHGVHRTTKIPLKGLEEGLYYVNFCNYFLVLSKKRKEQWTFQHFCASKPRYYYFHYLGVLIKNCGTCRVCRT